VAHPLMLGSAGRRELVRSIRRGVWLAVAVLTIVAASAAVSIARTPSEESAGAAPATARAMVVPDALVHRVGGAFTGIPDTAAMVLVGAALFGVAAAVKRAA
jgi:hypothetical protein